MDHKKAYEHIITGKLEALPLPDMAEAIWARIETRLDMDMPADDGGGDEPDVPAGGGGWGRMGLFVFITAFVTAFLIYQNNKKTPAYIPSQIVQPAQPPLFKGDSSHISKQPANIRPALTQNPVVVPLTNKAPDSSSALLAPTIPAGSDSAQPTSMQLPSLPVADTVLQKQKTRGVTGITDNDYRIVPAKKDSL